MVAQNDASSSPTPDFFSKQKQFFKSVQSRVQNIFYSFAFIRSQSLVTFKHPIFKRNLKLSEIFFSKFVISIFNILFLVN